MARYPADSRVKVYAVPSIANKAAPTTTELNAGLDLTAFTPKDGLNPTTNQNSVDTSSLADSDDTAVPGTEGGPITLTQFRDNSADTSWDHFTRDLDEFLVVREGPLASVAWASGDDVQVYDFISHNPIPAATATNERRTFTVQLEMKSARSLKSVVA